MNQDQTIDARKFALQLAQEAEKSQFGDPNTADRIVKRAEAYLAFVINLVKQEQTDGH
jgi:hypothetical protein